MKLTTLASGSSGNAIYIGDDGTNILIDCGLTGKKTTAALNQMGVDPEKLDGIIVTHEHQDHVKGIGVMSRKYDLPIYTTEKTWAALEGQIGELAEKNKKVLELNKSLELGEIKLEAFSTSHDAVDPIGLTAFKGTEKIGIATDTGRVTAGMNKHFAHCNLMLMEANHDDQMLQKGPYPPHLKKRIKSEDGHLSNNVAGKALAKWIGGNTQQVILAHLSQENNVPYLARKTVEDILIGEGIDVGIDLQVTVAPREESHPVVEIIKAG